MLCWCRSRQRLAGCLFRVWVLLDNLLPILPLVIWHIWLRPAGALLKPPFFDTTFQQRDRQQTSRDDHQPNRGHGILIGRGSDFWVQLRTIQLLFCNGRPRYRELLPNPQWPSSQFCCSLPFEPQTVSSGDAKACTSIHHMPLVLQTGRQNRPIGQWWVVEKIIPKTLFYVYRQDTWSNSNRDRNFSLSPKSDKVAFHKIVTRFYINSLKRWCVNGVSRK